MQKQLNCSEEESSSELSYEEQYTEEIFETYRFNFGVHKGHRLKTVAMKKPEYIYWLSQNSEFKPKLWEYALSVYPYTPKTIPIKKKTEKSLTKSKK